LNITALGFRAINAGCHQHPSAAGTPCSASGRKPSPGRGFITFVFLFLTPQIFIN
jgi:hypothetical protein